MAEEDEFVIQASRFLFGCGEQAHCSANAVQPTSALARRGVHRAHCSSSTSTSESSPELRARALCSGSPFDIMADQRNSLPPWTILDGKSWSELVAEANSSQLPPTDRQSSPSTAHSDTDEEDELARTQSPASVDQPRSQRVGKASASQPTMPRLQPPQTQTVSSTRPLHAVPSRATKKTTRRFASLSQSMLPPVSYTLDSMEVCRF